MNLILDKTLSILLHKTSNFGPLNVIIQKYWSWTKIKSLNKDIILIWLLLLQYHSNLIITTIPIAVGTTTATMTTTTIVISIIITVTITNTILVTNCNYHHHNTITKISKPPLSIIFG